MKKREQFNLALWDRLKKDNIPHTFETRNAREIIQLTKFDSNVKQPIVGHDTNDNHIEQWGVNGNYNINGNKSGLDLFIVWEEEQLMLEGYLYINPDNSAQFVRKPLTNPSKHIIAIKTVSIPYTKGEGLNDGNTTTN